MTIEQIVDYVMKTPYNTNPTILVGLLEELLKDCKCTDQSAASSIFGWGVIGDMIFGE